MKKIIIIFILFLVSSLSFSQYMPLTPYDGIEKEIQTDHFIIVYPEKYEDKALKVAEYAEEIHRDLVPFMNWEPLGRTTIILTNFSANPNGMATPTPNNTIILYLSPSAMEKTLDTFTDPLYTLIVHEYTHILHLDQIRDYAWFWRVATGRVYFPVVNNSFVWYREGTATLVETLYSENGRLDGYYNKAMVKVSALEETIPPINMLVPQVNTWPYNEATYHFGAAFLQYIFTTYGKEKFDKMYIDVSKRFLPIVHIFVWNFKNIYGKSMNKMWDEWIEYERKRAGENFNEYEKPPNRKKLTKKYGTAQAIDVSNSGELYYSISSYKTDRYLYTMSGKREKKLKLGSITALKSTDDKVIYSKLNTAPNNFSYYDLFMIDPKTRLTKRLTTGERINSIAYMNDGTNKTIAYTSYLNDKLTLYRANFNKNRIDDREKIEIEHDLYFIYNIDFSPNNSGDIVLSARYNDGTYSLICMNIYDNTKKWEKKSKWRAIARYFDDKNIYFTYRTADDSSLYMYNIEEDRASLVMKRFGGILDAVIYKEMIYYVSYTAKGEEIFLEALNYEDINFTDNIFLDSEPSNSKNSDKNINDNGNKTISMVEESSFYKRNDNFDPSSYKTKYFNPFRYLYPTMWWLYPVEIPNSDLYYKDPKTYTEIMPFLTPQFILNSEQPTGRFGYRATLALDYLRYYPMNSSSFWFKLPYLSVAYTFKNWASGIHSYNIYGDQWVVEKYNNYYPISLSNSVSLSSNIPLFGYGTIRFQSTFSHNFASYSSYYGRESNTMNFSQTIAYQYIVSTNNYTRWNRGIYIENYFYTQPPILDNILDNYIYYIFKNRLEVRAPIKNSFIFFNLTQGIGLKEINKKLESANVFKIYYDSINFSESIINGGSSNITQIPMRAFPGLLTNQSGGAFDSSSFYGSAYIKLDAGFDITVYKGGIYFYFVTMGLKEFYIRPYFEVAYLYENSNTTEASHLRNIFMDAALEFCLDMFVSYGNIDFSIMQGFALGYRPGMYFPAFNVYLGVNIGLGI